MLVKLLITIFFFIPLIVLTITFLILAMYLEELRKKENAT